MRTKKSYYILDVQNVTQIERNQNLLLNFIVRSSLWLSKINKSIITLTPLAPSPSVLIETGLSDHNMFNEDE